MKKILLVEDDPFLIDIYTNQFKKTGYEVLISPNGESAINKVKEEKPDLLILDIILPKMDGWEVLKTIRQDLKIKDLKIVILSNVGEDVYNEKAKDFDITKYIAKTKKTPSEVAEEIKKILN